MRKTPAKRRNKDMDFASETGEVVQFPIKQRRTKQSKRLLEFTEEPVERVKPNKDWKPIGKAQKAYLQKIQSNTITFGIGCAGTGKTLLPTIVAAERLDNKSIERIIVTRPAVSDEDYGALPGDLSDKIAPWFAPIQDILIEYFGQSHVENLVRLKKILFVPMGHLRGNTFKNAFIILDEAQNTTPKQMKTFLTRLGVNATCVITGDLNQTDIYGANGLQDAILKLQRCRHIAVQTFVKSDIVRSDIVRTILDAYEPDPINDLNVVNESVEKTT